MDTAVVGDAGLYDIVAGGFIDLGDAPAEEIVPKVSQVEGLVGIRRGIFDHDGLTQAGLMSEGLVVVFAVQEVGPVSVGDAEIEKAFDQVEGGEQVRVFLKQGLAQLITKPIGALAERLEKGEQHHSIVALEFRFGFVDKDVPGGLFELIQLAERPACGYSDLTN